MSQITNVKTSVELKSRDVLLEALQALGKFSERGNEIVFQPNSNARSITFIMQGSQYVPRADTDVMREAEKTVKLVTGKYLQLAVVKVMAKRHYNTTVKGNNVVMARRA